MNTDKPLVLEQDMILFDDSGLLKVRDQINTQIEELEAMRSVISEELLTRLKKDNLNGKVVDSYAISRVKRVNVKTKLEDARLFGAVMETVDTKVLKELHNKGVEIPDVVETEYLLVRNVEQNNEN